MHALGALQKPYCSVGYLYRFLCFIADSTNRGALLLRGTSNWREVVHQNSGSKEISFTVWKVNTDISVKCTLNSYYISE